MDDVLATMNTSAMIEDLAHIVHKARSGAEASDVLRTRGCHRADRPNLAVLLATGYAEFAADADRNMPVLRKPFTQDDLAGLVRLATG